MREGEQSTTVVLWREIPVSRQTDNDDDDDVHRRMFARAFPVFNVAQVDGYERPPPPVLPEAERLAHAEAFIANLSLKTEFGGSEAYYRPSTDTVFMPPFTSFRDAASFYGVWLHENGHASGTKHRLDRNLSGRFESAAYVASWIEVLKDDPKAIFTAASKAQQAADWMHAQQPQAAKEVAV